MVQNLADASYESAKVLVRDKRLQEAKELAERVQRAAKETGAAAQEARQFVARVDADAEARAEALMEQQAGARGASPPRAASPPQPPRLVRTFSRGPVHPATAPVR